ncbi:hypothetical protein [Flavobacterium sp.]|uniref:hypothetical protein n=1 Tax=Flavobacterium sp. TaxID=239 RepID=UPI00121FC882|nr:hypothetical protein [Flavobacterium sp.]RZJ71540.1 MAG: hypothetical protein EOO49_09275 [Flavobacterium sp.]
MFTKEQLAKWEADGFAFPPDYNDFAVETPAKQLSVSFEGASRDKIFYYVNFVIKAVALKVTRANLFVFEDGVVFNTAVWKGVANLKPTGTFRVQVKIPNATIDNLDSTFELGDFEFKGSVECDGLSAVSQEFSLKNVKKKVESQTKEDTVCLCSGDWSSDTLRNLVIELRKRDIQKVDAFVPDDNGNKQYYMKDGTVVPSTDRGRRPKGATEKVFTRPKDLSKYDEMAGDGKRYEDRIFFLDSKVKDDAGNTVVDGIPSNEKTYQKFVAELNAVFKSRKIDGCNQRIIFLAQVYQESLLFTKTVEGGSPSYHGGKLFKGRGLMQLTHDFNYFAYYSDVKGTDFFKEFIRHRGDNYNMTVAEFKTQTGEKYLTDEQYQDFLDFVPQVGRDLKYACQSAGWYWNFSGASVYAKDDNFRMVCAKINNPQAVDDRNATVNGYTERSRYYNMLKIIFDEKNC